MKITKVTEAGRQHLAVGSWHLAVGTWHLALGNQTRTSERLRFDGQTFSFGKRDSKIHVWARSSVG
jgi:hypothetical protein